MTEASPDGNASGTNLKSKGSTRSGRWVKDTEGRGGFFSATITHRMQNIPTALRDIDNYLACAFTTPSDISVFAKLSNNTVKGATEHQKAVHCLQ